MWHVLGLSPSSTHWVMLCAAATSSASVAEQARQSSCSRSARQLTQSRRLTASAGQAWHRRGKCPSATRRTEVLAGHGFEQQCVSIANHTLQSAPERGVSAARSLCGLPLRSQRARRGLLCQFRGPQIDGGRRTGHPRGDDIGLKPGKQPAAGRAHTRRPRPLGAVRFVVEGPEQLRDGPVGQQPRSQEVPQRSVREPAQVRRLEPAARSICA